MPVPTGYPVGSMYSSESDDFLLFKDPLYDTTNLYLSPHNEVSNFRAKPIQEVKGAVFLYTEEDPMVSTEFPERNRSLSKAEDAVTTDIASSASRSAAAALLPPPIPRLAGRIEKRSDIT